MSDPRILDRLSFDLDLEDGDEDIDPEDCGYAWRTDDDEDEPRPVDEILNDPTFPGFLDDEDTEAS